MDTITVTVLGTLLVAGIGFNSWFVKRTINGLGGEIKDIAKLHHQCRETLQERFASREDIKDLYIKSDRFSTDLGYIKGKLGNLLKVINDKNTESTIG